MSAVRSRHACSRLPNLLTLGRSNHVHVDRRQCFDAKAVALKTIINGHLNVMRDIGISSCSYRSTFRLDQDYMLTGFNETNDRAAVIQQKQILRQAPVYRLLAFETQQSILVLIGFLTRTEPE